MSNNKQQAFDPRPVNLFDLKCLTTEAGHGFVQFSNMSRTTHDALDIMRHLKKSFPSLWRQVSLEVEIAAAQPAGLALPEHVVEELAQEQAAGG